MTFPSLTSDGAIWTLNLGDDENRFSPDLLSHVTQQLKELAASEQPAALVTTGSGKFFSNGLDLDWLAANPHDLTDYVASVQGLFAQVLTLPVPTVALINGHAFGAGAMLAMAHDFRVMREDRGYFCFPEVDIHIPFTPGMAALIQAKLTPATALEAMTTGRRYGGPDARLAGVVDAVAAEEALPDVAAGKVRDHAGKHRETLGKIKQTMYASAIDALQRRED